MRWPSISVWLLGIAVGVATTASANQLTLTTSAPPGSPIFVDAGSVSAQVVVMVFNNVASDPVTDLMSAWQFRLTIVPDAGATGTVTFNSPATGSAPNPPNYVFGSAGLGIIDVNTGSQIDANDIHDGSGNKASQVPVSPGANLLTLGISASANASGLFGIYAVRGSAFTEWTDNNTTPQTRFFVNVPDGTGTVRIGEVSVPEPTALSLLCGAALLIRRRRM